MKARKKKMPLRRAIKGLVWLIIAFILFHFIGAVAPFALTPKLSIESAIHVEARAYEMQRDTESPDRAAILETNTEALDERIRLMNLAKREIVIATFECHDGESTRDMLAMALHKAEEGVRVRFLVDGIAGRLDHMPASLFAAAGAHPNIEIRFYNLISQLTPWRHMGRMHDKYVIVDDIGYILGGRNMFDKFLGDYPAPVRSADREALIWNTAPGDPSSSLSELRTYFEGMWSHPDTCVFRADSRISQGEMQAVHDALKARYDGIREAKPELFDDYDYIAATEPTKGVWLISNPTTIYAKEPLVFSQLMALMARAKDDVVIHSPYALLNRDMRDALSDVTSRVPTTLMLNAVENGANFVASSDYMYHRREVLSTGVRLLEYAGGISYHGKAVAIDDALSIIGSFNLDMRSTYIDTELMLVIRSEVINAQLRNNMAALHADCRQVSAKGETVPEGLKIPAMSPFKRAALRALGLLIQPVRNLL